MFLKNLTHKYNFVVPKKNIALFPNKERDACRLLYINKNYDTLINEKFFHITKYLKAGDTLVINNTYVEKSRFFAKNKNGILYEILIIQKEGDSYICQIKHSRKLKIGAVLNFTAEIWATIINKKDNGLIYIQFNIPNAINNIQEIGELPLPPYILKQRRYQKEDEEHYQTTFAQVSGSKASPTAGLHFTQKLLEEIKKKGINIVPIQLFISLGTFHPIYTEYIEEHQIHKESYYISDSTCHILNQAIKNQHKIIAVGTTSLRTLESAYNLAAKEFQKGYGETSLFIKPGYKVQSTDALITNFHTPLSTLFVLICSILGEDLAKKSYSYALQQDYKFFSYGDAMMIDNIKG